MDQGRLEVPGNGGLNPIRKGYIYFIRAEINGLIKIGYSNNPTARLDQLRIGSPVPLEPMGVIPGTQADEARMHQRFADHREKGEWFRPGEDLLAFIASEVAPWPSPPPPPPRRNPLAFLDEPLTICGETHTYLEWSKIECIPLPTLKARYRAGWYKEDIFFTPTELWDIVKKPCGDDGPLGPMPKRSGDPNFIGIRK